MSLISIISVFLFVGHVYAVEYDPSLDARLDQIIQTGGFYKPPEMPIVPQNAERAVAATFRIAPQEGTCSAVFLSDDGYVATALHCVEHCFHPKWNYQPPVVSIQKNRPGVYSGVQIPLQTPPKMNCPDMQSSNFWNYEFNLDKPEIVFVGRGMLTNDEKQMAKISQEEFDTVKDLDEDVAILKYENGSGRPLPCVPAARSMPLPNEPVWAIGFPVRGKYNGYQKGMSVGRARASMTEDPILQKYATEINAEDVQRFWSYQKSLWERPDFLLTNADGAHGNSGGLMIDRNGEFVGIAFSITKGEDHYNGGSFVAFSAQKLREELTRFLGKEKSDAVFNCSSQPTSQVHNLVQSSL